MPIILVSNEVKRKLKRMKKDYGFKSYDETISYLITQYNFSLRWHDD